MPPSALAGAVRLDGAPVSPKMEDELARAVARLRAPPKHVLRADGAVMFADGAGGPGPDGALFAASARLDNRAELAEALGVSAAEAGGLGDGELVGRMLARWGDEGLGRCLGAFAFARWEPSARRLTLGRDCLGQRALFFRWGDGCVVFASSLPLLLSLPDTPRDLDERVLANYLALNLTDARRTFYRAVDRIPSRTLLTIDPNGVRERRYWSPSYAAPAFKREADYVARARELLDLAVATAMRDTPHVAISTSGGLDSSAVAATAARLGLAETVTCYSLVAPEGFELDAGPFKYVDERSKLAALGRLHPALRFRLLAPDRPHGTETNEARLFLRSGAPILNPTNAGFFSFLHDAVIADGCQVLQTGALGNFGLTWSGLFSLASLARQGDWAGLARELPLLARETDRSVFRTFASEVVMRSAPGGVRRLIYRLVGRDPDSAARHSALNPAYIADHGLAAAWRQDAFDPQFAASTRDPAAYRADYLFDQNQYARDHLAQSYEQRGFEVRDAHADRRLIEFCLAVPEPMFRRRGVARSFARAVLADRLPPEILAERRTGMQDAQWFCRLSQRKAEIGAQIERLEASPSARRLLDLPRLKRLLDEWPADAAAAEPRLRDYRLALSRGVHVGAFIRWVEGGNA
jgi:asparagine synthase (glutamine-hydrolysing)